ncbi:MAG: hypothetical protein JF600_17705 [Xanthomonadales bacterium]|nr:hypothetical protein [Xanthomonadales bacterium]
MQSIARNNTARRVYAAITTLGLGVGLVAAIGPGSALGKGAKAAAPQPPSFPCGGLNPIGVQLAPIPKYSNAEFTDQGADCAMWQTFIYLNWPAKAGQRGVPDTTAKFGAPGVTVWESFLTADQVFLPNGATPQPWDTSMASAGVPDALQRTVSSGAMRVLTHTSKVSPAVARLRATLSTNGVTDIPLDEIEQADGNVLYDQQGNPVYYDIALNKTQYDYITKYQLYNADQQATFAKTTNIVLPSGSIEVKAAWKVLTATEAASGRFHMAKGYVPAASGPGTVVPIGLVGLHVFASGGADNAGLWATFYQIDNAPLAGNTGTQAYSFYNPASTTPVNTKGTNPTQVVQVFPDDPQATAVNGNAKKIIIAGDAASPWQYYAMIDTQWSKTVLDLKTPVPLAVPVSPGKPGDISTATLINPVLETFMQTQNNSCMGCHSYATTAQAKSTTAAGFSFMLGSATAPASNQR